MPRSSDRREFLQLAHVYDPKKHGVIGWYASEKMDGVRCFWDGGITKGMYTRDIPFANTAKDGIRVNPPRSTGLWSRSGKPIQAPLWFLDELPPYPLDGELYSGPGQFQKIVSTVKKYTPDDDEWSNIKYMVFDLPDYGDVFCDGRINTPNWTTQFKDVLPWLVKERGLKYSPNRRRFDTVVKLLETRFVGTGIVQPVKQHKLPLSSTAVTKMLDELLAQTVEAGGEGLILRHYNSIWEGQRTNACVKVKPSEDAEVTVTGYISGRETDRGSKLLGLMGAMIVDFRGKRLELSGFTDAERILHVDTWDGQPPQSQTMASTWCANNPGKIVPDDITSLLFPRGSQITIKYRELTNDGLPKEARYFRPRPSE